MKKSFEFQKVSSLLARIIRFNWRSLTRLSKGLEALFFVQGFMLLAFILSFSIHTFALPPVPEDIKQSELPVLNEIAIKEKSVSELMLAMSITASPFNSAAGLTNDKAPSGASLPDINFNFQPSFKLDSTQLFKPGNKGYTFYQGFDAIDFETQAIRSFAKGEGMFSVGRAAQSRRGVIVLRYGFDHPVATQLLADLAKSKLHSVVLVTDGPTSLDSSRAKFPELTNGQAHYSNDIRPDTLKETGQGASVRAVLKSGFDLKSPVYHSIGEEPIVKGDRFVTMSSHIKDLQIAPIMHLKETVMYVLKDEKKPITAENIEALFVIHGSANWTNVHFNRSMLYRDPSGLPLMHALSVIRNFATENSSAKISGIKSVGRTLMRAKDNSSWEVAYSDGKYELNQRTVQLLLKSALEPEQFKIDQEILSHFVVTNTNFQKAQYLAARSLQEVKTPMKVFGALDERFVDLQGYGLSATFAGYSVRSPVGKVSVGFPEALAKNVEFKVDFEDWKDTTDIDPDGKPTFRNLWHDKTTIMEFRDLKVSPVPQAFITTGSYNLSNNFKSLERQDVIILPYHTPLVESFEQSVRLTSKLKEKMGVMLPLSRALLLKSVADFTGQTAGDISLVELKEVEKWSSRTSWSQADTLQFNELLRSMNQKKSRLGTSFQVSESKMKVYLGFLNQFIKWWLELAPSQKGYKNLNQPSDLLTFGMGIVKGPELAKFALSHFLWRPNINDDISENLLYEAFSDLHLAAYYKSIKLPNSDWQWSRRSLLKPNLFTKQTELVYIEDFKQKKFQDLSLKLGKSIKKKVGERGIEILDAQAIQIRLEAANAFIAWYGALSDADFKNLKKLDEVKTLNRLFNLGLPLIAGQMTKNEFFGSLVGLFSLGDLKDRKQLTNLRSILDQAIETFLNKNKTQIVTDAFESASLLGSAAKDQNPQSTARPNSEADFGESQMSAVQMTGKKLILSCPSVFLD